MITEQQMDSARDDQTAEAIERTADLTLDDALRMARGNEDWTIAEIEDAEVNEYSEYIDTVAEDLGYGKFTVREFARLACEYTLQLIEPESADELHQALSDFVWDDSQDEGLRYRVSHGQIIIEVDQTGDMRGNVEYNYMFSEVLDGANQEVLEA